MSKNLFRIFLTFTLVAVSFIGTSGDKAYAAPALVTGYTATPSAMRTMCTTGEPVDFAVYPSNVSLNLSTGVLSYNINIQWKRCNTTSTRAYAIYSDAEVCPVSGYYSISPANPYGVTTDCVKYIGNPAYSGAGNGLKCWQGINDQCVTANFSGARRVEDQPSNQLSSITIPMSTAYTNWAGASENGNWVTSHTMCQFYKTGSSFTNLISNRRCETLTIGASWTSLKPFQLSPYANVSFDDREKPNTVSFGGGIGNAKRVPVNSATITRNYQVKRLSGATSVLGSSSITGNIPASGLSLPNEVKNIASLNLNTGDKICQIVSINQGSGNIRTDNGAVYGPALIATSAESCDTVINKPYVSFFGGDVNTCSDIKTFYKPSTKVGSGVQYVAQANSSVDQFTSAFGIGATPKVLTFANTESEYGGGFLGACITRNYFTNPPATPEADTNTIIDPNTLTPGSKLYNAPTGGIELIGGSIQNGARTALYINGDLRITGNITYANTTWANIAAIPSLHVYVKGNIYIQPGVTNLTGFFVAQKDGASKGTIYTCANGTSRMPIANILGSCATQLKVRGAFSSNKTYFDRSIGSLRNGSPNETYTANSAAETFFIGPEMYFVSPGSINTSGTTTTGGYQYITTLPPVL